MYNQNKSTNSFIMCWWSPKRETINIGDYNFSYYKKYRHRIPTVIKDFVYYKTKINRKQKYDEQGKEIRTLEHSLEKTKQEFDTLIINKNFDIISLSNKDLQKFAEYYGPL